MQGSAFYNEVIRALQKIDSILITHEAYKRSKILTPSHDSKGGWTLQKKIV